MKIIFFTTFALTKLLIGEQLGLKKVSQVAHKAIYITQPPSDSIRLYVLNQSGFIQIIKNGNTLKEPFLDISSRVNGSQSPGGLLGLAFHPNYKENGFFYLSYINKNDSSIVSRFSITEDIEIANKNSEKIIMKLPKASNHNISGHLAFGPNDHFLYISFGDSVNYQSTVSNSINYTNFYGKILRINVDNNFPYVIPPDNPFFNNIYKKSEIFCFGLQSPRRFSFDKLTNDFLIPDISKKSWQEINWNSWGVSKNANFGWNLMEGNHCFDQETFCDTTGLIMPVFEYPNNVSYIKKLINMGNQETYGCAVVGGYVYRGDKHYTLYGSYVFGDHCSNQIWVLNKNKNGKPIIKNIKKELEKNSQGFPITISSFGEDSLGELYIVDYIGAVYKFISN